MTSDKPTRGGDPQDEALSRFLDGEPEPGDAEVLLEAMRQNPGFADEDAWLLAVDDLLRQCHEAARRASPRHCNPLAAEENPDPFIRTLLDRIGEPQFSSTVPLVPSSRGPEEWPRDDRRGGRLMRRWLRSVRTRQARWYVRRAQLNLLKSRRWARWLYGRWRGSVGRIPRPPVRPRLDSLELRLLPGETLSALIVPLMGRGSAIHTPPAVPSSSSADPHQSRTDSAWDATPATDWTWLFSTSTSFFRRSASLAREGSAAPCPKSRCSMSKTSRPLARRSWPLWAAFHCCTVAAVCIPLVFHRSAPKPWNMTDLAGQVQQTRPELHLLPVHPRYGVATGFYLSTDNLTTEDAVALPCDPDQKGRWHGVVLCRQHRSDAEREDWIAQWRDGGIILPGDIVVVGDPELVRLLAGLAAAQH